MGYTDSEVWKLTPKQLAAQMKVHHFVLEAQNGKSTGAKSQRRSESVGFIDQVPGW